MRSRTKTAKRKLLEHGLREATLQDKAIRLAHAKPELRPVLVPLLKQAAMSESDFWAFIKPFGWGTKTTDYDAIEKAIMRKLSAEEADDLDQTFRRLKGRLYKRIEDWERENDRHLGLGDDGFDDLLSHIVGLGKREYDAVMANPELAYERAQARYGSKDGFTESFSYALPSSQDYKKLDLGKYKKWAQENVEGYEEALQNEAFKPLYRDIRYMIEVHRRLLDGDLHGFMAEESKAKKVAESLEKERSAIMKKMLGPNAFVVGDGGDPMQNKWGVWNLFSDIEQYLL